MAPDESTSPFSGMSMVHKSIAGIFAMVVAPVLVAFGIKFSDTLLTKAEPEKSAAPAAPANPPAATPVTATVPAASGSTAASGAPPAAQGVSPASVPAAVPASTPDAVAASAAASPAPGAPRTRLAGIGNSASTSGSTTLPQPNENKPAEGVHFPHFKKPLTQVVRLFNGRDLSGFYTYLGRPQPKAAPYGRNHDPEKVFSVNGGLLHVSGEMLGVLETVEEYEDYWLTLEYKWGDRTWPPRAEAARHSAVLINVQGPDGAVRSAFPVSIHCQLIEGATGEFLLATGNHEHDLRLTVASELLPAHGNRTGTPYYKPGGPLTQYTSGAIKRYPPIHSEDVKGFRPPGDLEHPHGEWNQLDIVSLDGKIFVQLNDAVVNFALHANPDRGRIGIQSNGAEIIFRTINLQPYRKSKKSQDK